MYISEFVFLPMVYLSIPLSMCFVESSLSCLLTPTHMKPLGKGNSFGDLPVKERRSLRL